MCAKAAHKAPEKFCVKLFGFCFIREIAKRVTTKCFSFFIIKKLFRNDTCFIQFDSKQIIHFISLFDCSLWFHLHSLRRLMIRTKGFRRPSLVCHRRRFIDIVSLHPISFMMGIASNLSSKAFVNRSGNCNTLDVHVSASLRQQLDRQIFYH